MCDCVWCVSLSVSVCLSVCVSVCVWLYVNHERMEEVCESVCGVCECVWWVTLCVCASVNDDMGAPRLPTQRS